MRANWPREQAGLGQDPVRAGDRHRQDRQVELAGDIEAALLERQQAAVVYFVICFSLSMMVRRLQAKIAIIR